MATINLDLKGLNCPQPILKIAAKAPDLNPGDVIETTADCDSFENDLKRWCDRMNKVLLWCRRDGDVWTAQIQF